MKLGDVCEFKTGGEDCDFWIVRKGTEKSVGKPTRTYSPEYIGVKVKRTDLILPDFLYYYFEYLSSIGIFTQLAMGSLNLKHIRISEIKDIPIQMK
jgi:hypothetical protein